jgi:homoserine kinase
LSPHAPARGLRLSLPATSANLGPGFDAAGLALSLQLRIEAHPAEAFAIDATGRDAALCASPDRNLVLDTYRDLLARARAPIVPLRLTLHNEIPLGMGCGSSAAALLAGVALASHFGGLGLTDAELVAEAGRREGHPDNVAACWYGGFTVSAADGLEIATATFPGDPAWQLLLALPPTSLATSQARALLPDTYSKADAVFNVQRAALLTAAFAQGRLDLLRIAMQDRLHQPYRTSACPLLGQLLPLAPAPDFAGIALSGAGPSVLLFLAPGVSAAAAEAQLRPHVDPGVEFLSLHIARGADCTIL